MEHFCTLLIFRGLFFQLFLLSKNRHFTKTPKIYSINEDNRQRKTARTKGKLFNYLGIAYVKTKLKFLSNDHFQDGFLIFRNSH